MAVKTELKVVAPRSIESTILPALTWQRLAALLAGSIFILTLLGIRALNTPESSLGAMVLFHLDRELNIVTMFSAGLLVANGCLVWQMVRSRLFKKAITGLAFLFLFMGADEMLKIHETLEKWSGIDWQILYSPLILAAGIGWLMVWWKSEGLTRVLWTAGAGFWVISQLLEAIQWGWGSESQSVHYNLMMVSEEVLEMSGSALFLIAVFRILRPSFDGSRTALRQGK